MRYVAVTPQVRSVLVFALILFGIWKASNTVQPMHSSYEDAYAACEKAIWKTLRDPGWQEILRHRLRSDKYADREILGVECKKIGTRDSGVKMLIGLVRYLERPKDQKQDPETKRLMITSGDTYPADKDKL